MHTARICCCRMQRRNQPNLGQILPLKASHNFFNNKTTSTLPCTKSQSLSYTLHHPRKLKQCRRSRRPHAWSPPRHPRLWKGTSHPKKLRKRSQNNRRLYRRRHQHRLRRPSVQRHLTPRRKALRSV